MMRRFLFLLLLFFATQNLDAKKTERVEVSSIEELLDIDDWDNLEVVLTAEEGAVWRADKRKDIKIEKAKNFILDGGENPPTIYGHRLIIDDVKKGEIKNLIVRTGGKGFDAINDVLTVVESRDLAFEKCSFTWGTQGIARVSDSEDVTFKQCLFAEPLQAGKAEDQGVFNYGCLVNGSKQVEFDSCLFAHCPRGNPVVVGEGKENLEVGVAGSLIYGYSIRGAEYRDAGKRVGRMKLKLNENLFQPSFPAAPALYVAKVSDGNDLRVDLADNEVEGLPLLPTLEDDENVKVSLEGKGKSPPLVNALLDAVGAKRTATDQRIVDSILSGGFQDQYPSESDVPEYGSF